MKTPLDLLRTLLDINGTDYEDISEDEIAIQLIDCNILKEKDVLLPQDEILKKWENQDLWYESLCMITIHIKWSREYNSFEWLAVGSNE